MSAIYGMQRANGDWFTLAVNGRSTMPLFHTMQEAFMSRLRNFRMLLFKPVKLNSELLKKLIAESGGQQIDLCLIEDPFVSLERQIIKRTKSLNHTEITFEELQR